MVRARVRAYLDALKQHFPDQLGACEVHSTKASDYAFRLFVDKRAWTQVVTALADDIDYDNFKAAVERHQGRAGDEYVQALHDVWSVMYEMQKR